MPLISIIVPVYNVEKYLRRCVDSILAQTHTNIECILVDDGSTDGSPALCDEYAAKDSRVVVIHQQNGGASAARNAGLDVARGEWIGFVDSDDWIEPDMYRFLYEKALETGADVTVGEIRRIHQDTGKVENLYEVNKDDIVFDNHDDAIIAMLTSHTIGTEVVKKLIRAAILKNIRFNVEVKTIEDEIFSYFMLKQSKKILYYPTPLYNYFLHPESKSRKTQLTRTTALLGYDKMLAFEKDRGIRKLILTLKLNFASAACVTECAYYSDERWAVFAAFARKHLFGILTLPVSMKSRIARCFCVLCPGIFARIYRTRRLSRGGTAQ